MNRNDLLKHIADTGYNVGFGAKKHFATYDIVDKVPGFIGFLSMAVGIFALIINALSTKFMSAAFIVLGIVGLYISFYDSKKHEYEKAGAMLTQIFNELKTLYAVVKSTSEESIQEHQDKLSEIEARYYSSCISKQILFSDWYAHYKFFWQHQIDWVHEQKSFTFLRDKVPLTLSLTVVLVVILLLIWGLDISKYFCSYLIA